LGAAEKKHHFGTSYRENSRRHKSVRESGVDRQALSYFAEGMRMRPNNLQLLIILSVTVCMAAGSFSANATVAQKLGLSTALIATR
jgi:hypothetical protein